MNKIKGSISIVVSLIILIVIIGGVYLLSRKEAVPIRPIADSRQEENQTVPVQTGLYIAYSPEKISLASQGPVVLFFKASWCPTCRALDADILANLDDIPKGMIILDVDYDSATALKQKYKVTYQHTLVQVDASRNQIAKWSNSLSLADVISHIK